MSVLPLARRPYGRIQPATLVDVDKNLRQIEQQQSGMFVPRVLVFGMNATAYTVKATDWLLLCDCTGGAITLTFPLAARVDGFHVTVIKTDASANAVTLSGTFSGLVNPTITQQHGSRIIDAGNGVYEFSPSDISGTAGKVANALSLSTHLSYTSGTTYDGSAARTIQTDATSADTASTIASRDANSVIGAKGIQFPATQSASSDPNCLDDYEEGTWTPTVAGSGGAATYIAQTGVYVKTGRFVEVQFQLRFNVNTLTGNLTFGGLPFTSDTTSGVFGYTPVFWSGIATAVIGMTAIVGPNGTTMTIYRHTAATTTADAVQLAAGDCDNDQQFICAFVYRAAA